MLYLSNLKFNLLSLGALMEVGAKANLSNYGEVIGEVMKQSSLYYIFDHGCDNFRDRISIY